MFRCCDRTRFFATAAPVAANARFFNVFAVPGVVIIIVMIIIIPYSSPISSWINFQLSKLMRPDGPWLRAIILMVVLITISIIIRLINRRTKRRLEILLFPRVTLHADHGKHVATKRDRLKIRARHRGRGWGGKSKKIIIFKPTYPIPFHAPLTA